MEKTRLDDLLVEKGLAADRKTAAALILAGRVLVDDQRIDKPGTSVDSTSEIRLKDRDQYVSRGGLKLEGALRDFAIDVDNTVCLDLGASTGGFTDCLLQHGARRVYALDVGKGQLDWKLQKDARVKVKDQVNVRNIHPSWIGEPVDLITIDVSFISLRLVLPPLRQFSPVRILALVKPQFEAERDEVSAGGIIVSEELRRTIVERIRQHAVDLGLEVLGQTVSPIAGQKGNQEYFLLLSC